MTSHIGRMYAIAAAIVVLFLGWAAVAAHPWDAAPFPVIFAESGGVFTDWRGRPGIRGGSAVAGNPAIHAALLETVRRSRA